MVHSNLVARGRRVKGQVVGERFLVLDLAGSGGMADVYRARDQSTGVEVALKVLRGTGPDDLARLAREAQAISRLTHPGIVRYVAHGTTPERTAFVAMEWVEGETLSRCLHRGPLKLASALELGRALASALGHAHDHGIVHRDIKPGNVILRRGDLRDPILLDFGVARTGLAVGLTQLGTVIGTPRYMAPEQARGGTDVDARADVFALGAVLYKCITGHAPFDGDDAIAILAHLFFDDTPDVCDVMPNVPRAVGEVLKRMMAKEPDDRYANAAEVARALEAQDPLEVSTLDVPPPAAPSGLTLREKRLLSLMVLSDRKRKGAVDATVVRKVAADFGARTEALVDGSVVVFVSGRDNASDLARVSARCALDLRGALPDADIVLATGRSEPNVADRDPTSTQSGTARYSGVFEHAAGLLRREVEEARPYAVLIDDATAGLLGADFDVVRGEGAHALRAHSAATRAQYTLLGKPTPFVGRAREVSTLVGTWDDVREQGVARALLVVGDAGAGKSRLLHEAAAAMKAHATPALWLRAKADTPTAGSPFAAIGAAIRREAGIADGEPVSACWQRIADRVARALPNDRSTVADFVAEIAGVRLDAPTEQLAAARRDPRLMGDRIRQSWRAWMAAEAARGPVLVVLEDLQWGDLPTVRLVEDMLQDLADSPIFVLAFARPEIDAIFPNLWSRVVERLPLLGLSKKAATAFVRATLPPSKVIEVDRIVGLASGNALHLEELVRSVAEGNTGAPDSLLTMLGASVESLPDDLRRTLRAASIFGVDFWVDGVRALLVPESTERARAEARARIDSLVSRELLETRESSRFAGQTEVAFRNTLVRDVTYAMLTDEDKRLGHALAADWLERAGESDPFVLAQHAERGGLHDRAITEYARSAAHALDAADFATALARVERAKVCGATGDVLAGVLLVAAEARRWRGETHECAADAWRAVEQATPGTETYFRALRLACYAASFGADEELATRAAGLLRAAHPRPDARRAYVVAVTQAATGLGVFGRVSESDDMMRLLDDLPAEIAANAEVRTAMRLCHSNRAFQVGDFAAIVREHTAIAERCAAVGDRRGEAIQAANVAFGFMWLGLMEDALDTFERSRAISAELGLATTELNALQNTSFIRLCMGDADAALRGSRGVLARAEVEAPRLKALAHLCAARAQNALGDHAAAEREARAGLASTPIEPMRAYAHSVLADALRACGRLDESLAESDASLAIMRTITTHFVGDIYAHLVRAELLAARGVTEQARASLAAARALFEARRAMIPDEASRVSYDARSPESSRLRDLRARMG